MYRYRQCWVPQPLLLSRKRFCTAQAHDSDLDSALAQSVQEAAEHEEMLLARALSESQGTSREDDEMAQALRQSLTLSSGGRPERDAPGPAPLPGRFRRTLSKLKRARN